MIDPAADLARIAATDGLFRDATRLAAGSGLQTAVRVLVRRPDGVSDWGQARVILARVRLTVPVDQAADLARGDSLTLGDGTVFRILADPVRDPQRGFWTAEAEVVP